jgi:protein TonB
MKKITLTFLIILSLIPASLLRAKEEPASPPLPANSPSRQPEMIFPFEAIMGKGPIDWAETRAGQILSSGYHAPDFTLPSLQGDPVPIRYPRWAVREGWEGSFMVAVEILETGKVGRWKVMESTGYPLLDQAATHAVQQWLFHPAREQGQPIVSCIQIPIHFKLKK